MNADGLPRTHPRSSVFIRGLRKLFSRKKSRKTFGRVLTKTSDEYVNFCFFLEICQAGLPLFFVIVTKFHYNPLISERDYANKQKK